MALVNNFDGRFFFCEVRRCLLNKNGNLLKPCTPPSRYAKCFPKFQNMNIIQFFWLGHEIIFLLEHNTNMCYLLPLKYSLLSMFTVSQEEFFFLMISRVIKNNLQLFCDLVLLIHLGLLMTFMPTNGILSCFEFWSTFHSPSLKIHQLPEPYKNG